MTSTRIFYAVLRDEDDIDWGYGSYNLDEAKRMAKKYGFEAYIAVICENYDEKGNVHDTLCVDVLHQEDF